MAIEHRRVPQGHVEKLPEPPQLPTPYGSRLFGEVLGEDWADLACAGNARSANRWHEHWCALLDDPITLWHLALLQERIAKGIFSLGLGEPSSVQGYGQTAEEYDRALAGWHEGVHSEAPTNCTLYRIVALSAALRLFDVVSVAFDKTPEEARFSLVESAFKLAEIQDGKILNVRQLAEEIEGARYLFGKLTEVDPDVDMAKPIECFRLEGGKVVADRQDTWELASYYGEHMEACIKPFAENVDRVRTAMDGVLDELIGSPQPTRSLLFRLGACKRLGGTVFLPFADCFESENPLFAYLYWLDTRTEKVSVTSWFPDEGAFQVTVLDPEWRTFLGIDAKPAQQDDVRLSYDRKQKALMHDGKPLAIGGGDADFLHCFFKLKKGAAGVEVGLLSETLDSNVAELDAERRRRLVKSLVYERIRNLNGRIERLCGAKGIFWCSQGFVHTRCVVAKAKK